MVVHAHAIRTDTDRNGVKWRTHHFKCPIFNCQNIYSDASILMAHLKHCRKQQYLPRTAKEDAKVWIRHYYPDASDSDPKDETYTEGEADQTRRWLCHSCGDSRAGTFEAARKHEISCFNKQAGDESSLTGYESDVSSTIVQGEMCCGHATHEPYSSTNCGWKMSIPARLRLVSDYVVPPPPVAPALPAVTQDPSVVDPALPAVSPGGKMSIPSGHRMVSDYVGLKQFEFSSSEDESDSSSDSSSDDESMCLGIVEPEVICLGVAKKKRVLIDLSMDD